MSDKTADMTALLLIKSVTRIHGRPERNQIDVLEKEVARIASSAKTTRFPQGNKYGHLVMIVGETKTATSSAMPASPLSSQRTQAPTTPSPSSTTLQPTCRQVSSRGCPQPQTKRILPMNSRRKRSLPTPRRRH